MYSALKFKTYINWDVHCGKRLKCKWHQKKYSTTCRHQRQGKVNILLNTCVHSLLLEHIYTLYCVFTSANNGLGLLHCHDPEQT